MNPVDYTKEENFKIEFNKNISLCIEEFKKLFNESLNLTHVCAPGNSLLFSVLKPFLTFKFKGRVNLIGEHTDYNDGFVFPMAIPLYTIIVGARNNDPEGRCRIKSLEPNLLPGDYTEFIINDLKPSDTLYKWSNYIKGVVANFKGD
jgi:galactokinase